LKKRLEFAETKEKNSINMEKVSCGKKDFRIGLEMPGKMCILAMRKKVFVPPVGGFIYW